MSYGQRSKNYDWFKQSNDGNKKTAGEKFKTFGKFLRIFIYFCLFFFSMYGCVQSFFIKVDDNVSRGFEIYTSEKSISPHVTSFSINKREIKIDDQTSEVYFAKADASSNIFFREDQRDQDGELILEKAHQTIQMQNKQQDLRLSDAWQGLNESFVVNSNVEELKSSGQIHKFSDSDNYALLSSLAEVYNLGGQTNVSSLEKIKFWVQGKTKTDYRQVGIGLYQKTGDNWNAITTDSSEDALLPRNQFNIAFINHFFGQNPFYLDFISKDPRTIVKNIDDEKAPSEIERFYILQKNALANILGYVGVSSDFQSYKSGGNLDPEQDKLILKHNYMPLIGYEKTDYRPVVSWGQAWSLGPFYGLFVFPIGKIFAMTVSAIPLLSGWETLIAIVTIVVISRIVIFALSFKSTMQQTKMQDMQAKKAIIDAKYAPYEGNKQMESRKKQEQAELYRKMNINPLGAFANLFLMMPIFLAIWRVIGGVQQIKSTVWLGINFSATSWRELLAGQFQYLPLIMLAAGTQLFAQLFPRLLTRRRDKLRINVYQKAAMKKNNKMQNISMFIMVFLAVIFSAGIQIYWIIGGLWRIFEVYITHKIVNHRKKSSKRKKDRTVVLS
ncbi:membrane protein insertase YidC [Mycoplasma sp. ATU-Cv-703]|uniref:membrane protein insertase YidC n=1 Tax=Mycoplasma sp. ATU-Cv-703 TaxID=2498595 RepID=UPI000FDEF249